MLHMVGIVERPVDPSLYLACILTGFGALAVIAITFYWLDKLREKIRSKKYQTPEREPSAIRLAYESWKGKYCARVKFVDESKLDN